MKFLSTVNPAKLTITRTTRKAVVDHAINRAILTETVTTLEFTLPSILQDVKARFSRFVRNLFTPPLAHYCACA